MDNVEKYELIESYLANEMPEEQRRAFEEQFSNDKELLNEFRLNRELADLLGNEHLHKFLNTVHETDANWKLSPKKKKNTIINMNARFILAIAASLAIIIFTWQYFFVTGDDPAARNLYSEYFEPYQMVLSQRSEADTAGHAALVNQAVQEYANGNYSSAANAFQQLWNLGTENISYRFYSGLSLLGSGETSEAIEIMEELLETRNHLFTEQSRWYLALAYISADDESKAVDILRTIGPGQFQYGKSLELISELN